MDALLGAMEPTIHRLSILPSVTARRKPHGGIFQGSSMYFFWGQVTHPSPARQCPAFPGGKVPSEARRKGAVRYVNYCLWLSAVLLASPWGEVASRSDDGEGDYDVLTHSSSFCLCFSLKRS